MHDYVPDPVFAKAMHKEIVSAIPFLPRQAVKLIPESAREAAVTLALAQVIPLSFGSIALSQVSGATIRLTRSGDLEADVKQSLIRRIALWLAADEASGITFALQHEIVRLATEEFGTDSWRLSIQEEEAVLTVMDTSMLRESADTVMDVFFNSFETLKGITQKFSRFFTRKDKD